VRDTTRLLTRHFFRRFVENDLISPDADRHQTLAVLCACIVSFGLVVTMLLALKYVGPMSIPGQVSLNSLDDKFLYIGWSMAVMALVTLAEWDALALDVRDASILGPLPIPGSTIFHAKATALVLFAGGCTVMLNLVPSLLFTSALVVKHRRWPGALSQVDCRSRDHNDGGGRVRISVSARPARAASRVPWHGDVQAGIHLGSGQSRRVFRHGALSAARTLVPHWPRAHGRAADRVRDAASLVSRSL
jgi:hypothetical protein